MWSKRTCRAGAVVSYRNIEDVEADGSEVSFVVCGAGGPCGGDIRGGVLAGPGMPAGHGRLPGSSSPATIRKMAIYLPPPKIESDDPSVQRTAEEAIGRQRGGVEKVEAIHNWVHKNIVYSGEMENMQTCMKTIELRRGVCAEMNSLAVAMLRATRFPARLVRIPGHVYFEVYLLDGEGQGHWIAGDATRDAIVFGRAIEGMILQKGDNVNIIDPNTKQSAKGRILAETIIGLPQSRSARLNSSPSARRSSSLPRGSSATPAQNCLSRAHCGPPENCYTSA